MGFKINKSKSWQNATNKQTKNAFSKKARVRNNDNWNDFTNTVKDDTRKTAKSIGKGIDRKIGMNNFWLYLGIGGAVFIGGVIFIQD